MFQHILVPLDGSENSRRVLALLPRLVDPVSPPRVTLLGIVEAADSTAEVRARLAEAAGALGERGRIAEPLVRNAVDASEGILRVCAERGADLVLMATHGRTGLARLLRGSVAERVLRRCPAPLLLCNPRGLPAPDANGARFRRILVPHDGSEVADAVLEPVAELARAYAAEVVLFKAETFQTDGPKDRLRNPDELLASLDPLRERLHAAGVPLVRTRAAFGAPVAEILRAQEASEADLLALSTHGRSGPSRWWFGSVAEALVREAPCPLFVVRVPPAEPAGGSAESASHGSAG